MNEVNPQLPTIWSIIINWKCAEETCACLASLMPTVDPATVIVIDNGSADGSVETIHARFPAITLLAQDSNLGFAKAANIGIARALAGGALSGTTDRHPLAMQDVLKPLRYTSIRWVDTKLPSLPSDYQYTDAKAGDVIQPKVMSDAVDLSMTLTFLSLVFWTFIIGPVGVLESTIKTMRRGSPPLVTRVTVRVTPSSVI